MINSGGALRFVLAAGTRFPVLYLLSVLGWVIVTLLPLATAQVLGSAVEEIAASHTVPRVLLWYVAGFVLLEGARVAWIYLALEVDLRHRSLVTAMLRINLVRGVIDRAVSGRHISPGDVTDRTRSDVHTVEDAVSEVGDILSQTLFLAGTIALLSWFSPE